MDLFHCKHNISYTNHTDHTTYTPAAGVYVGQQDCGDSRWLAGSGYLVLNWTVMLLSMYKRDKLKMTLHTDLCSQFVFVDKAPSLIMRVEGPGAN